MKEQQQPIPRVFTDTRQPGMKGINTIVDPHDIDEQSSPDILNMYFDQGVIGIRPGYSLFASKPTGETGTPLQLAIAKTSDGVNYIISVYTSGTNVNNFYVWDSVNSRWISINGAYAPTFSQILYFGSQNWNMAYADDRIYFGNKYDDTARWRISLNYLSVPAAASDEQLTLTDASRFHTYSAAVSAASSVLTITASPNATAAYTNSWERGQMVYYTGLGLSGITSGNIYYAIPGSYGTPATGQTTLGLATTLANAIAGVAINISGSPTGATVYKVDPITIYDGNHTSQAIYYNRVGNVLSLVSSVGNTFGIGSSVCPTLTDRPAVPKGNVLNTYQARFVSTAGFGTENTMFLSRINEPEDYIVVTDDITSGGFQIFNDGGGGIIDVKSFGQFLLVEKTNGMSQFSFQVNTDLSSQIATVVPIITGIGMGPMNLRSNLLAMNSIYYPSGSAGFIMLSPLTTGTNASTGLQVISYNINNIYPNYNFSNSKGAFYKNKLFWTAQSPTSQNVIFVYDTIRQAWTKFDSWNPADMAVTNSNQFLFLSAIDGNVYQAFSGYTENGNPVNSYFYTKLNTMGRASMVKTVESIYIEGYMTQSTTIYADVLYNEKGSLFTQTYEMSVGTTGFQFTNVDIDALGMIPFNQGIMDSLRLSQIQNFGYYRGFLAVPLAFGLFALEVKFYTKQANAVWYMTGHAVNPLIEPNTPPTMMISPLNPLVITF